MGIKADNTMPATPILDNLLTSNNVFDIANNLDAYQSLLRQSNGVKTLNMTEEMAIAVAVDKYLCNAQEMPQNAVISLQTTFYQHEPNNEHIDLINQIQASFDLKIQKLQDSMSLSSKTDEEIRRLCEERGYNLRPKCVQNIKLEKDPEAAILVVCGKKKIIKGNMTMFVANQFFGGRRRKRWLIDNLYEEYMGDQFEYSQSCIGKNGVDSDMKKVIRNFQKQFDTGVKEINIFIGRILGTQKDFIEYVGKGSYTLNNDLLPPKN